MKDLTFTNAKAIGIMAVVVGHSGCPQIIHDFIYCFHMPLFFMISGYFFKESNAKNMKHYLFKKVKRLYIPYVAISLLFIATHNLWFKMGMTENYYTLTQASFCALKAIAMAMPDVLAGPLWFLKSLLVSFVLLCFLFRMTENWRYKDFVIAGIVSCLMLFVALIGERRFVSYMLNRDLIALGLVYLGYVVKQYKLRDIIGCKGVFNISLIYNKHIQSFKSCRNAIC